MNRGPGWNREAIWELQGEVRADTEAVDEIETILADWDRSTDSIYIRLRGLLSKWNESVLPMPDVVTDAVKDALKADQEALAEQLAIDQMAIDAHYEADMAERDVQIEPKVKS